MTLRDWRDTPSGTLAPVYARERQRWLEVLRWDPAQAWAEVETARTTWGLPGLVVVDDHQRIRGTMFFLPQDDRLDIGGITAESTDDTQMLIDGVLERAGALGATLVRCFVYDSAPGLQQALRDRRFALEEYLYLVKPLMPAGVRHTPAPDAKWRAADRDHLAPLLEDSYDPPAARLFAPHGEAAEWREYVRQLIEFEACGAFDTTCTGVRRDAQRLLAAAVVTRIAPQTAHLAQLAVHPSLRGRGIAAALVDELCEAAAAAGRTTVTLLVSASNVPARQLYANKGFTQAATFVAAETQPRRLTSVALASVGAITRR